jgi:hypothetical protein
MQCYAMFEIDSSVGAHIRAAAISDIVLGPLRRPMSLRGIPKTRSWSCCSKKGAPFSHSFQLFGSNRGPLLQDTELIESAVTISPKWIRHAVNWPLNILILDSQSNEHAGDIESQNTSGITFGLRGRWETL